VFEAARPLERTTLLEALHYATTLPRYREESAKASGMPMMTRKSLIPRDKG
jgi:hypothetical protein